MMGELHAIVLCLLAQSFHVEAQGGMLAPATPETNTPAVIWDLRLKGSISEDWHVFVSVPFWKLSNFHPTSNTPGYITDFTEWPFDAYGDYSEKHSGLLLGVERRTGPVSMEAALGSYSRELMLYVSGVGKTKRSGEMTFDEDGLMASFALKVPVGNHALLSFGARTEGFDHWYFALTAGLAFSLFSSGRGQP